MHRITQFEEKIAEYFGSPYAVAVDSCTHGLELCLRLVGAKEIIVPKQTYLSVPMLAYKLNIDLTWIDYRWDNSYPIYPNVWDAAVMWGWNKYKPGKLMSVSFQYQKHLSLGRGGMILLDDVYAAKQLKLMSYDGRQHGIKWREQDIDTMGYHYYMTPETAELGLQKINIAIQTPARKWSYRDYPDLTKMKVFK